MSWDSACAQAKVEGKFFHDFRRTAIRNIVRAAVPERVAMKISGHKTRSVFDRYHIFSDEDLKEAARKQQAFHEKENQMAEGSDQRGGEVIPFPLKRAKR